MRTAFVVFSGYNDRAVIAFLRSLRRHHVDCFIVANGGKDRIFCTPYGRFVACVRDCPALSRENIAEALDAVVVAAPGRRLIYAPSTEALNRFFLENRDLLDSRGIELPLVDECLYSALSDKQSFGTLCCSHGILVPGELSNPEECSVPFVAKPVSYDIAAPVAPILVMTEADRSRLLAMPQVSRLYFQQFVDGRSLYLLLHVAKDGRVLSFSQENLVQQPNGKSIIAAIASDFHLDTQAGAFVEMLKGVRFHGLIMIEVRFNDDGCYMIEANPRFWGPSQLFVDAMAFDLFDAFLADLGIDSSAPKDTPVQGRYFWLEGLISTLKSGGRPVLHNYDCEQLSRDFSAWVASDVYGREDTKKIFSGIFD